jgi:hypothetical protein
MFANTNLEANYKILGSQTAAQRLREHDQEPFVFPSRPELLLTHRYLCEIHTEEPLPSPYHGILSGEQSLAKFQLPLPPGPGLFVPETMCLAL